MPDRSRIAFAEGALKTTRLSSRHLAAEVSAGTGNLVSLSLPGRSENLIRACFCRYDLGGKTEAEDPARPQSGAYRLKDLKVTGQAVTSVIETDEVEIKRSFELPRDAALLQVRYAVRSRVADIDLNKVAFPCIQFGEGFLNAFEDEEDLYFDGEELGGGMELPCWRVIFKKGHNDGLIMAARSKLQMSRFFIQADHLDIKPHGMVAYDTGPNANPPMELQAGSSWSACFEIGAWQRENHRTILGQAGLETAVNTGSATLCGPPAAKLEGVVLDALDFAGPDMVSAGFAEDKWMRVDMPCCHGRTALYAGPSVRPPALTVDPKLRGVYRVIIGLGNGNGVAVRFADEEDFTFRVAPGSGHGAGTRGTPFHLRLSGAQEAAEVIFQTARMDGRQLVLGQFPNLNGVTVLDYVRFEEVSAQAAREPVMPLSGFFDTTPVSYFMDARDPDPSAYRASLREHVACGIKKVYWRIDGQCSDFPCTTNTMRYASARVHSVFQPQHKAYGRVLRKVNLLSYAVEAARDYGIELYGWMRFNSYAMNVQSDFYKQNTQFHEKAFDGSPRSKLCIAIPEVRKHKRDILVEAAGYGLHGLNLGFLRHPPVLCYAPILVEGFRRKYGEDPPMPLDPENPWYGGTPPPTDEKHVRWFQYRADFLTQFGRELKDDLKAKGLEHVKISLWLSAKKDLHDGIDTRAWLEEGLCDEIVAEGTVKPEWRDMVRARALLYRGISFFKYDHAIGAIPEYIDEGCDGICTYESDWAVLDSRYIDLYHGLGRSS